MLSEQNLVYLGKFLERFNQPLSLPFYHYLKEYLEKLGVACAVPPQSCLILQNLAIGKSALKLPDGNFLQKLQAQVGEVSAYIPDRLDLPSKVNQFIFYSKSITMPLTKRTQINDLLVSFKSELEGLIKQSAITHAQEMCSGKANLALTLAEHYGLSMTGYDINPELMKQLEARIVKSKSAGKIPSGKANVFNVLETGQADHIYGQAGTLTVALHACGELSDTIIRKWAAANVTGSEYGGHALLIVPCCYDRFRRIVAKANSEEDTYFGTRMVKMEWFSKFYQERNLPSHFNLELLHNLTTQVKGSDARQTKLRKQISQRRLIKIALNLYLAKSDLGKHPLFDGYTHSSGYRSIPDFLVGSNLSLREALLETLNVLQAGDEAVPPGTQTSIDHKLVEKVVIEAVRLRDRIVATEKLLEPAKRLFELALLDDRALFLKELGYRVVVRAFTSQDVTPRNMAIMAIK